jgi:hypothetical protein
METEMKRILAALGVTGLALLGATAPAAANDNGEDDHKITICHATGAESNPYVEITGDFQDVKAHAQHGDDIIPANRKWEGRNWDEDGQAIYYNGCAPCLPEVVTPEEPPVVTPEKPPVTPEQPPVTPEQPPVTPEQPPVVTPVAPPVVTPIGAVVAPPAAPAVVVKNPGFNVQTAVAGSADVGIAPWVAAIVVMLLAAAGVVARRTLASGGTVSGPRKE